MKFVVLPRAWRLEESILSSRKGSIESKFIYQTTSSVARRIADFENGCHHLVPFDIMLEHSHDSPAPPTIDEIRPELEIGNIRLLSISDETGSDSTTMQNGRARTQRPNEKIF